LVSLQLASNAGSVKCQGPGWAQLWKLTLPSTKLSLRLLDNLEDAVGGGRVDAAPCHGGMYIFRTRVSAPVRRANGGHSKHANTSALRTCTLNIKKIKTIGTFYGELEFYCQLTGFMKNNQLKVTMILLQLEKLKSMCGNLKGAGKI
jgi:hypothetical protein